MCILNVFYIYVCQRVCDVQCMPVLGAILLGCAETTVGYLSLARLPELPGGSALGMSGLCLCAQGCVRGCRVCEVTVKLSAVLGHGLRVRGRSWDLCGPPDTSKQKCVQGTWPNPALLAVCAGGSVCG